MMSNVLKRVFDILIRLIVDCWHRLSQLKL
jgi:hypothetical protein